MGVFVCGRLLGVGPPVGGAREPACTELDYYPRWLSGELTYRERPGVTVILTTGLLITRHRGNDYEREALVTCQTFQRESSPDPPDSEFRAVWPTGERGKLSRDWRGDPNPADLEVVITTFTQAGGVFLYHHHRGKFLRL
ncbi:hypothetical protein EYF80_039285 [Liparis tanakae]|uniref:Uncharacterized protein n=1 Tax=Liparis tanakae TaxID=230148 RepID=A0A4Z2GBM3_9TELE|nr:hypothetical protein EYF80_039285 [Liparis tanakae]